MRTWTPPPWAREQQAIATERGFVMVKDYKSGRFIKVRFGNAFRSENQEGQDLIIRLEGLHGESYYLDAEELRQALRYA